MYLIIIFLVFIPLLDASYLVGYDCESNHTQGVALSLVDIDPCEMNELNTTIKEVEVQLIQPREFKKIQILSCLIMIRHEIILCASFWGGKNFPQPNGIYTEVYEVSREECDNLHGNSYYSSLVVNLPLKFMYRWPQNIHVFYRETLCTLPSKSM